jgi:hypothetical protein
MIRCGLSTPQHVTLNGTGFPAVVVVLVTPPNATTAISVTPLTMSSTVVTFEYVFATCGTYTVVVADATGACDDCASDPFTLNPTAIPCPTLTDVLTLQDLREQVQHRLGDDDGAIWTTDEVDGNLVDGYLQIATQLPVFWDIAYAENLPRGFSVTQPWELLLLDGSGDFNYGVANFTAGFERLAGASMGFDSRKRYGPANHTSPFEATDGLLSRAGASTAIPATAELPKTLTKLDRVSWDTRAIDALEPRSYARLDSRFEITTGEVYGFMWQKDGVRTLRKVKVPASQCDTVTVTGSWGVLRTPADLTSTTPTGTWGIARVIEGHHPIGPDVWGAPRRVYLEGKNVRVEHFRQGRVLSASNSVCELPNRYARYIVDYAIGSCLDRPGPGYDALLAKHFLDRWRRGLARIARRLELVDTERVAVMGGAGQPSVFRPPRPALPWAYGSRVR